MIVVTGEQVEVAEGALAGKERDTLSLSWEERRWTRRRARTSGGREVVLALPTGSLLRPGAVIVVEPTWYLAVEGRPEPVLAVVPRHRDEAIRIAFEVGNRHFPLAIRREALLVPDDTAMVQLLARLGLPWERREDVFDPVGGAGHRHAATGSHGDGHGHPEDAGG